MKLDPYLIPYIKINSKWIKDLNVWSVTITLPEENRKKLLSLNNDFLDMTPKAQATKANKTSGTTLKCSYISTVHKKQLTKWKDNLHNRRTIYLISGLYPQYKRNSCNQQPKKSKKQKKTWFKNEQKSQTGIFSKKTHKWPVGI